MFPIGVLYPESVRNDVRNAGYTVLKATEKHTQERNNEPNDGVCVIDDTATLSITTQTLVNEHDSVLYPCHSDVQLYRPTSVVEMATVTIDMIRTNHSSKENNLKTLLHLELLSEHGT